MNKIKDKILLNNFSIKLRNLFNYKPLMHIKPVDHTSSVSEFFFFYQTKKINTKFILTNLASQILPNFKQNDKILFYAYDSDGKLIIKNKYFLKPHETKEIFFKDFNIDTYGSFFVFHNFEKYDDLINQGCNISEKGYVGYKTSDGVWNFMHGNHNASCLKANDKIKSLISKSFFNSYYYPQVTFNDTLKYNIIFNNPSNSNISFKVNCYNVQGKLIEKKSDIIGSFCTKIFEFDNKKTEYIEVISKFIFCRPIIMKHYQESFDIFHG